MNTVFSHLDEFFQAFWLTIRLFVLGGLFSLLLGTVLAAMRVGPIGILRAATGTYVTVVRNTPLLLVCIFVFNGLPSIGIDFGFMTKGVIAVSFYTSTFVCEAIRSGINSVNLGQAEAARAIGLTFTGTMQHVVLPQAVRASVPPLASVMIALLKNTSVTAAFGLLEATAQMRSFTNDDRAHALEIFALFALGYVVLVELVSAASAMLERRWRVTAR